MTDSVDTDLRNRFARLIELAYAIDHLIYRMEQHCLLPGPEGDGRPSYGPIEQALGGVESKIDQIREEAGINEIEDRALESLRRQAEAAFEQYWQDYEGSTRSRIQRLVEPPSDDSIPGATYLYHQILVELGPLRSDSVCGLAVRLDELAEQSSEPERDCLTLARLFDRFIFTPIAPLGWPQADRSQLLSDEREPVQPTWSTTTRESVAIEFGNMPGQRCRSTRQHGENRRSPRDSESSRSDVSSFVKSPALGVDWRTISQRWESAGSASGWMTVNRPTGCVSISLNAWMPPRRLRAKPMSPTRTSKVLVDRSWSLLMNQRRRSRTSNPAIQAKNRLTAAA